MPHSAESAQPTVVNSSAFSVPVKVTIGLALAFSVAGLALVAALMFGEGAPRSSTAGLPEAGALTGWGISVIELVVLITETLVIGLLLVATFLLPNDGPSVRGIAARAVQLAGRFAWIWAVASVLLYWFTVSDLFAVSITDALNWPMLSGLTRDSTIGRGLILQTAIAIVIAVASRWIVSLRVIVGMLLMAIVGLVPSALAGHAAAAGSHDMAVVNVFIHVLGSVLWVGGLCGLLWVAWRGSKRLAAALRRYSALTLWSVLALSISGIISGWLRVNSLAGIQSKYAILLLAKAVLLVGLVALGAVQRSKVIANLDSPQLRGRQFARLAGAELMLMSAVFGIAIALSRSPFPAPDNALPSRMEQILGMPMPPQPTLVDYFWGFYPSGLGLSIVAFLAVMYGIGVLKMRRRGNHWPIIRVLSWYFGVLILAWTMFGGIAIYSHVLFSVHMITHMMTAMVAPIFLVLGAPMTLALRTLPGPRQPGEISPRKLLNDFLQSRFSAFVTHPIVAALLFVGSLYAVYFTGLFDVLMWNHWGHMVMEIHFLMSGFLYYYVVIGIDPSTRRLPPLARFGVLMFTMPFHAFFAIGMMQASVVVGDAFYSALDVSYTNDLLRDQYVAGSITWALGEVPILLVMIAMFVQWVRSDWREARRHDRSELRTGDAELEAYNAYLESIRQHDMERNLR